MFQNSVDILENNLQSDILKLLLHDHTTGRNIFWATHDYEHFGKGYQYADEIRQESITGKNGQIVKPRVLKTREQQSDRVKDMAEVFTPSWVVKMMVDNVDFDIETRCMELTCGEAPFIVSRYDATTGEPIAISERIGILDRKLRMVNDQQLSDEDWLVQVRKAFQSTYGYEWQGDSLLLARENLLYTFIDHYEARHNSLPDIMLLQEFAGIISWNLWQMDGLSYRTPQEKKEKSQAQISLFEEVSAERPAPFCIVMDWQKEKTIKVIEVKNRNIMKFDVIIGNPPYHDESKGDNKRYAPQLYNIFIDEAYKIADVVELIHPARFLFNAGSTPKSWNKKMLNDIHFCVKHFESNAKKLFPNTEIPGGIAISYHDHNKTFIPIEVFSSYSEVNTTRMKIVNKDGFKSLSGIVKSAYSYHFSDLLYKQHPDLKGVLSDGHDFDLKSNVFEKMPSVFFDREIEPNMMRIYGRQNNERIIKFIKREYIIAPDNVDCFKVFIAGADGAAGTIGKPVPARICGTPTIGDIGVGCTESFISIGAFKEEAEAECALKYMKTKFARFLLGILKATQAVTPKKFKYVPLQDFTSSSDIDWSKSVAEIDERLFDKYGLDEQERNFIRTKVKEMA